jgi:high-affinity Fe2+/Pb2+ permease
MRKTNGNRFEPSAQKDGGEGSDKRPSIQHLRPNLQPIHHIFGRTFSLFTTFAVFFLFIATLIERWGIVATFGGAILVALLVHGGSLLLLKENRFVKWRQDK